MRSLSAGLTGVCRVSAVSAAGKPRSSGEQHMLATTGLFLQAVLGLSLEASKVGWPPPAPPGHARGSHHGGLRMFTLFAAWSCRFVEHSKGINCFVFNGLTFQIEK